MELGKTLYVSDRRAWRSWLAKNHDKEREIWLVYLKKHTGKPRIPYNDAVEEALCFGWIDSTVKRVDAEKFAQRFSPRRARSELSQMNKERVRMLIEQKKMTDTGLKAIAHAYDSNSEHGNVKVSKGVMKALRENPEAWGYFQNFPESYKRIRIAYIESRRRQGREAFQKSLRNFVRMTAKNKRFGFFRG
ncbi:MAG: YdeI/OmpD-associated family protein [Candidatus Micrarchaeota archaeon]